MALKQTGRADDWAEIDRFETASGGGVGWLAHPDEGMQRASHALAVRGDVWLVDPVDAPGIDDLLADLGTVAGVVITLDRHTRDADEFARRHDVPVYVSDLLAGVTDDLAAPVERYHRDLADTGFGAHEVIDRPGWHEIALYHEDDGTLFVPEAVGTAAYFLVGDERLGVHPMLRLTPPRKLARLSPERVLVGHGAGIHEDAASALAHGLEGARVGAPRLYWQTLKAVVAG